ncbi:hypothetical protein ABFS83_01G066300 [Erythranthe nasuta]
MNLLFKSKSRTVHNFHDHDQVNSNEAFVSLTVWRKSLLLSCSGFTVIGSNGSLAYRVDNYSGRPNPVVLMDGSGNPIFTICRRQRGMRLMNNYYWLIYEGEVTKYCKNNKNYSSIVRSREKRNVLAHVYSDNRQHKYVVEGSYMNRSCKIFDESRNVVGEIKRKEAAGDGVSYGLEVFNLLVKPGFESGFAMAIVLVLDQMFY